AHTPRRPLAAPLLLSPLPRPPPRSTLFPYTTLFRSRRRRACRRSRARTSWHSSTDAGSPPTRFSRRSSRATRRRRESASARCARSEEHTSELQSRENLVCRLLLEKKKKLTENIIETN